MISRHVSVLLNYSVLITMDMFDFIDIQRMKNPNVNKYSYESKPLKMKSIIDYFLIAKHLIQYVRKADIQASIGPDHKLVLLSVQWEKLSIRGPGFWKFNNSLSEVCLKMKIISN